MIKNDGTQFIWAGDLAKLYIEILNSHVNRKLYFGLSKDFVSWHKIAQEAVKRSGSKSQVQLDDEDWSDDGLYWDVSGMKDDFNLEFDPWDKIVEHLDYYISLDSSC